MHTKDNDTISTFAINAHAATNHMYDEYLTYEFHLRMVVKAAKDFIHILPAESRKDVIDACWLHDSIEDARLSYSDVKKISNKEVAEMVRAVTNYGRGRNRHERMPEFVYNDIRDTPHATFVKLCDRIANVQYSKMTGSDKFDMYQKEQAHFEKSIRVVENDYCATMWDYLHSLLNC